MAKTPDFTQAFQNMMSNFPTDNSGISETFKTQTALGEKMSRVALEAAERSTEVSAQWARDAISRLGELSTAKDQPADYAKAMSDFATAAAEIASQHMSAYAEIAKKVQMDTVDIMLNAGKDVAADAQRMTQKATADVQNATRNVTGAGVKPENKI
ncbi:phasin family protein [Paracoccus sp. Z118]|uniref:phasin family protein n=1 Tax=Paracoccus sp. Z118 TaxID=2851017 RepID=UPI001C2CBA26|nr:phasin family protein [Paracoccus sp. Z118]MBV0893361.1 phasin family protein [Paracoccus sp. Z118]